MFSSILSRDEAVKNNTSSSDLIEILTEEKKNLENVVAAKTNEITKLHSEQQMVSVQLF